MGLSPWSRCWRALFVVTAAPVIVVVVLVGMTLEPAATIQTAPEPGRDQLAKTRNLLFNTVRTTPTGGQKQLKLTASDLQAVTEYALWRKKLDGRTACHISDGQLIFAASFRLPYDLLPLWINIRVTAADAEPQAHLKQLTIGRMQLPPGLIALTENLFSETSPLIRYSRVTAEIIDSVRVQGERLQVTLNWNSRALARAQDLATGLADKERIMAYRGKLAEVVGKPELRRFVRLGPIIHGLFTLARDRSEADSDPVGENRAAILVLNTYVNGSRKIAGVETPLAPGDPPRRDVLLNRRIDSAQHFAASAALAISGHSTLADMVGLAKEMNDTHGGSGFSFNDLAADQAGAMFGKLATHSESSARRVQEILVQSSDEAVYMPGVKDLPENLDSATFAQRFKDLQSPEFLDLKAQIQQRILACELFRQERASSAP